MLHPLVKLLATHPELLATHLGAYADLAGIEAAEAASQLQRKAVLTLLLGTSAALGLGLTALAVMMAAVVPVAQMPYPWLLVGVPTVAWLAALGCGWRLRHVASITAFGALREQIGLDAQMLRQVQQP